MPESGFCIFISEIIYHTYTHQPYSGGVWTLGRGP